MDKKIPLIISTFIAAAGGLGWQALPVSAESINVDTGESIWALDELTEIEKETDEYLLAQCGKDLGCQREQFYNLMENDLKYQILNSFQNHLFLITSVNPSQNTLKAYHQSRDDMTRWFGMNPDENLLTELRIGWSNLPDTPLIVYKEGYIPTNQALLPEDFHFAYSADEFTHGQGWFPSREEVEIRAIDDIGQNSLGILQYTMMSVFTNASGTFGYSSCINSPYYQPGMECRAVFSDRSSLTYLPYENGALADPRFTKVANEEELPPQDLDPSTNSSENDDTAEGKQSENLHVDHITNSQDEIKTQPDNQPEPTSQESANSQPLTVVTISSTSQPAQNPSDRSASGAAPVRRIETVLAVNSANDDSLNSHTQPNKENTTQDSKIESTSNNTYDVPLSGNNREEKEFPWWIFALLCSAVGVFIWWFIVPSRNKREK